MRALGWIITFVLVTVLGTSLYALAHRSVDTSRPLVASHLQHEADPPHVFPALSPVPAPTANPTARPAATSSGGTSAPSRPAPPSVVVGSQQQRLINADRAAHGLGPLSWSGCLYSVAVANARRIAAQEYLSHTNGPSVDLTCHLGYRAGENIGYTSLGVNDGQLNTMFMNSPEHYANIMGPYHYVATAWVIGANGYGYIAVEFG